MKENILNFLQQNSPDGGFLQSEYWRKFQESTGKKTHSVFAGDEGNNLIAHASIIEHALPFAGKYFYVPRGPVVEAESEKRKAKNHSVKLKTFFSDLIELAKENNVGWIRIEPANIEILSIVSEILGKKFKIKKSAVDMQPREILVTDISGSEEEILAKMKQKTRYNIRLSQKRGVKISRNTQHSTDNIDEFLRLVKITAQRDRITSHPESYYRKMFEIIPGGFLKLYVADYKGKVIAANLVVFFGKTATYLHGASDNVHRDAMAPYSLQWQAMLDAKQAGCERYDLGGVKSHNLEHGKWNESWGGITKFKTGFAPNTKPIQFPGCYDIILRPGKYNLYRMLQKIKRLFQ